MSNDIEKKLSLKRLADKDDEIRTLRDQIAETIRIRVKEELALQVAKRDMLAYAARQAGNTVTAIANVGLHTTNRTTAYDAIARGQALSPDAPVISTTDGEVLSEFTWNADGTITIRPDAETLTPVLEALGIEPGEHEAIFELNEGRLLPVTPIYVEGVGRHPVVALVIGPNPEYRNRALAWAEDKVAA